VTVTELVAQLLADLGCGTYTPGATSGDIYLHALPQTPDIALAVALYPGAASDSRLPYDEVRAQVRTRGTTADSRISEQRAQLAYDALIGVTNRTLSDGAWLSLCTPVQGGPIYMGRDESGRHEHVVNLALEIHRPTANRP